MYQVDEQLTATLEQWLIGFAIVVTPESAKVVPDIPAHLFTIPANRTIWGAMCNVISRNEVLDYVTLIDQLRDDGQLNRVGGAEYLLRCANQMPGAYLVPKVVQELSRRRALLN